MESKYDTFGEWWEALIKSKGYTINKLSKQINANTPQLYGIRDNTKPLSVLMAFKIERLAGISATQQLQKQVSYRVAELKAKHKEKPLFPDPRKKRK